MQLAKARTVKLSNLSSQTFGTAFWPYFTRFCSNIKTQPYLGFQGPSDPAPQSISFHFEGEELHLKVIIEGSAPVELFFVESKNETHAALNCQYFLNKD